MKRGTNMQIAIKVAITLAIILISTGIGKKYPSLAGLIAVMPLTGALVLIWLYLENKGDPAIMQNFTKGAVWGILPSILFFVTALFCFHKQLPLPIVLCFSFGIWLAAAGVHQYFMQ
jgi:uncharacterized membrane protein (GlpM family)